jgi:hypothetical protein
MGGTQFLTVGGGGQAQNRVGFGIADFFMYKVRSATIEPTATCCPRSVCDGGRAVVDSQGGPDVPCSQAPRVFWGHSQPTWQVGVNSTLTLWKKLRLYARVDGNGGNVQSNTEIARATTRGPRSPSSCATTRCCRSTAPSKPMRRVPTRPASCDCAKSRPPTRSPRRWRARVGPPTASLSVAGRNLSMLWTEQHGWNTSRDGQITVDVANMTSWDPEIRAVGSCRTASRRSCRRRRAS